MVVVEFEGAWEWVSENESMRNDSIEEGIVLWPRHVGV